MLPGGHSSLAFENALMCCYIFYFHPGNASSHMTDQDVVMQSFAELYGSGHTIYLAGDTHLLVGITSPLASVVEHAYQGTSGLVLKDSTWYGKSLLKHSTCEVP
jgi:hypothetical protein